MELVIDQPHLVDTLRFQLYAAQALPQEDIRLIVTVTALVPSADSDRAGLERRIREALAKLASAPWTFTRIEREEATAGYERVTLRAATRVPALENWNLPERARAASGEGLALATPEVSYALSSERVDAAVAALRVQLLEQAMRQAESLSKVSGREWRVGDIEFGAAGFTRERGRRTGKGAYADEESTIELLALCDTPSGVTSGERITLLAAVVLKSPGLQANADLANRK